MKQSYSSSSSGSGISFSGALFLVFLILKLTGHITWSWWWVTSPLWIGFAMVAIVLIIIGIVKAL